ncbi:MAG TPA: 2,3-diaminopropionate biosynthesis protein SbnB [Longimicrobium sp.]|nr:2,3-diaminopropionate biosynthesis protein SbnB [Longimicrobium sp.]
MSTTLSDGDLTVLAGADVAAALDGCEAEILDAVSAAYQAHSLGETSLPHSTFLRFPHGPRDRIIALPAYLGGEKPVAGVKWIASFPGNLQRDLPRASAVMVLNSAETGRAETILEASTISAKRTAASAALAAQRLCAPGQANPTGVIGCGPINLEVVRFLAAAGVGSVHFRAFDLDADRARQFAERCRGEVPGVEVEVVDTLDEVLRSCPLVSLATTAAVPHISDLSACPPGAVILHVSLRDLSPEIILDAYNVVDDVDHVNRAETSIHLASKAAGNVDFVHCTLGDLLLGRDVPPRDPARLTVFSPFGLGMLDLAVAQLARSRSAGRGVTVPGFSAT